MKKYLFILACAFSLTMPASAQKSAGPEVKQTISRDTTSNTDTSNVDMPAIGSNLASIDAEAVFLSGTPGGKFYLYGRTGSKWNLLDSSSALSASVPFKTFLFDRSKYTLYKDYRVQLRTSTTQTSFMIVTYMRRPDEP